MVFADLAFFLYVVYIFFIIALYALEISAVIENEKKAFRSSFYRIFAVLAAVDIIACLLWCFLARFPLYPIVNSVYRTLQGRRWWISAAYAFGYYLNCLSQFLGLLLAINRFTALHLPQHHEKIWRRALIIGIVACALVAVAPIVCLIDSPIEFLDMSEGDGPFSWYYLVGMADAQAAIWFNIVVMCNAISSLLYAACIIRLCLYSINRNHAIERNLFFVGFSSMVLSLPYMATVLYLHLVSTGTLSSNNEIVSFVIYQMPWLTDLKYLSPAPILLITTNAIRSHIRALLSIRYASGSVFSATTSNTLRIANMQGEACGLKGNCSPKKIAVEATSTKNSVSFKDERREAFKDADKVIPEEEQRRMLPDNRSTSLPSSYTTKCAILCGVANLIVWTGFNASAFVSESILHSVNGREPEKIGAHDGFYGFAVTNAFYMLTTLIVPSIMDYVRSKWILTVSAAFFTLYFLSFLILNRLLYFSACAALGIAFSAFNVGFSGYLTEFSTRKRIERNTALSWAVTSCCVLGAGIVNLIVTAMNTNDVASKYREYSDTEIRYFYATFSGLGMIGLTLFALLPNQEVDDNIATSNVRCKKVKEHISVMFKVLFHKRVLILAPFYLYIGLFFSFWISVIPTSFQFTKALSHNVYIPTYFGVSFTVGSVFMSLIIMKLSKHVKDFCLKPLMIILAVSHSMIYILAVSMIPQWSTVRPNDEPSLLIEPSIIYVIALAFLCGIGDVCNNSTRTVLSSLILPTRKQQTFGASRFYHALSATILFVASPSLSIYTYVLILSIFLLAATITFLYSCKTVRREEKEKHVGV